MDTLSRPPSTRPEFYDTLPSHPSWLMVIVNFIRDKDVGLFARAKRLGKKGPHSATDKVVEVTERIDNALEDE
jgi:hypothetical protein